VSRRSSAPATRAAHLGPAVRRPLVLDAALAVWDSEGYRGTTMAAIAARAGVSKPVLYECYDNKDDVLRALLDREEGLLMSATQAALPVGDAKDLRATVTAAYEAFFDAVLAHPVSWRIVVDAQRVMPAAIESRYHQARELFVEQIAELVRRLTPGGEDLTNAESLVLASNFASLAEDNASLLLRQEPGPVPHSQSSREVPPAWTPASLAAFVTRVALDRWI
jgi:AcrR family transcriptional regulator